MLVYTGGSTLSGSTLTASLTGNHTNSPIIVSPNNWLIIHLSVDSSVEGLGFMAEWGTGNLGIGLVEYYKLLLHTKCQQY